MNINRGLRFKYILIRDINSILQINEWLIYRHQIEGVWMH